MKILKTMKDLKIMSIPMVILAPMIFLSSCEIHKKVDFNHTVGRSPAFSDETKEKAVAACIKMKQKEHGWKSEDIRSYCEEHWRGYITFIEESKGVKERASN